MTCCVCTSTATDLIAGEHYCASCAGHVRDALTERSRAIFRAWAADARPYHGRVQSPIHHRPDLDLRKAV